MVLRWSHTFEIRFLKLILALSIRIWIKFVRICSLSSVTGNNFRSGSNKVIFIAPPLASLDALSSEINSNCTHVVFMEGNRDFAKSSRFLANSAFPLSYPILQNSQVFSVLIGSIEQCSGTYSREFGWNLRRIPFHSLFPHWLCVIWWADFLSQSHFVVDSWKRLSTNHFELGLKNIFNAFSI